MTWDDVKKQYKGIDRALFVIKEYIELGSYSKIAEKYGTDRSRIGAAVSTQKKFLEKQYPELYSEYRKISISNKGKTDRRGYSGLREDWNNVKKQYNGIDRVRFVMKECIEVGGLSNLEKKYGVPQNNFCKMICRYKSQLEKEYPQELENYKNYGTKRRGTKIKINHIGKKFKPEVFDMLDKEVTEYKFLDFIRDYNTGDLSTMELIKMANDRGIKIYEIKDDGSKRIIKY